MVTRRIEFSKVKFRLALLVVRRASTSEPSKNNMPPSSHRVPSTPAFYILFCVATVLVLKEVNSIVWEPYMVSRPMSNPVRIRDGTLLRLLPRTNRSTSHKAKRIAEANGQRGTQKSRLHRVCEYYRCINGTSHRLFMLDAGTSRQPFSDIFSCSNADCLCFVSFPLFTSWLCQSLYLA